MAQPAGEAKRHPPLCGRQEEPAVAPPRARNAGTPTSGGPPAFASLTISELSRSVIGHPDAGQRTAIIYSIVVSCQRHGVDPHEYLRDVLTKLPGMTTRDDIDALLPSKWCRAQRQQIQAT